MTLIKQENIIDIHSFSRQIRHKLPLYSSSISAGFPSPADDYIEQTIDLNDQLIHNPDQTFFIKVQGDSMIEAAIHSNDILIVDRSVTVTRDKIIIASVDDELIIRRLTIIKGKRYLVPESVDHESIEITPETDFRILGVVTYVIHSV